MRKWLIKLEASESVGRADILVEAETEVEAYNLALANATPTDFIFSFEGSRVYPIGAIDKGPIKINRKMASIQRVVDTFPIPGADAIEGCQVLGWKCVIKKGKIKKGDLCVYFEIDSVLPHKPEFEFMEPRKYHVKTVRLKGQVSQGLVLPLSSITYADLNNCQEGDDVTELLGVEKYEPELPAELRG